MPLQCVEGERRNKIDKEETTCLFINTQSDVRTDSVEQLVRSKGKNMAHLLGYCENLCQPDRWKLATNCKAEKGNRRLPNQLVPADN